MHQETSRSTRSLLAAVGPAPDSPLLDIGSPNGGIAKWAANLVGHAAYCHLDLLACRAAAQTRNVTVHHSDELPEGPFATVVVDAGEFEPAYVRELGLSVASILSPGGVCFFAPPRQEPLGRWQECLSQWFADVLVVPGTNDPPVLAAREPLVNTEENGIEAQGLEAHALKAQGLEAQALETQGREPEALEAEGLTKALTRLAWDEWAVDKFGRQFRFRTGHGVFSPRGLDTGTRALIEAIPQPVPGTSFLDLGCGVGVVAVIAASVWSCQVTAADVNARALRLTAMNAGDHGVADRVHVLPSNGFSDLDGMHFDVIATNPPYHTDYGVGKAFIEGAHRHLRPGGTFWMVVKQADWYINKMRAVFGGCRVLERDGYFVLMSERRDERRDGPSVKAPKGIATTRKHIKRLQEGARRKKRK